MKTTILVARKNLERKIALEVKTKPKSFWKYIGRKTKPSDILNQVRNSNGELTKSNRETAVCLNTYFSSVFTIESEAETMPYFPTRQGT